MIFPMHSNLGSTIQGKHAYSIFFFLLICIWLSLSPPILEREILADASSWIYEEHSLDANPFSIIDSRHYGSYIVILGNGEKPCPTFLLSYKQTLIPCFYTRYIMVSNAKNAITGIGLEFGGNQHMELLLAPPYNTILVRNKDGRLSLAPQTQSKTS